MSPHRAAGAPAVPAPSQFVTEMQTSMLRSVVTEAVSSLQQQMHQSIGNLHLELLRQFHVQQVTLYCTNIAYLADFENFPSVKHFSSADVIFVPRPPCSCVPDGDRQDAGGILSSTRRGRG